MGTPHDPAAKGRGGRPASAAAILGKELNLPHANPKRIIQRHGGSTYLRLLEESTLNLLVKSTGPTRKATLAQLGMKRRKRGIETQPWERHHG